MALPLTGCYFGRSKIVVSDGGSYEIYANESYVCSTSNSDCSLTKRGGSGEVQLRAVKNGEVAGETYVSRSITAASVIWAPFTYYTSLFIYKAYPDEIYIYVGDRERYNLSTENGGPSIWRDTEHSQSNEGSVWDKPLL